ncbi:proline iminopeptidase, putative [Ichthyophthirius multifiliis]|uniref:Proline iminopeptidase n=1 Tax=Ichthyophthirius multifiliis TaxID=5932 RepID=G0QPZ6_ICHMU|nr:proline iminopeptidase, putative [Ichthyophthirius multifiliis]EGR32711.1 proline iminopeptidase, putative [Ichthyophthirius multifiliis]|eukprot:XP_004036697.1 proline iminopeptidase, putative [Ichthyophthirius multifiliis]
MQQTQQVFRQIYKYCEPFRTGNLKVSQVHTIYWEISGNPEGLPVVILHGGPGGGSLPFYRGFFDPQIYKIVQFDQRGSGKSTPFACLEENTTWHLVEDIEKLREHLEIKKWHTVFGGSWGSTLSLAYAQTHPDNVGHLIIRGVFMVRRKEIEFFYQEGSDWIFPDFHEEFKNLLPEVEKGHILHNYYRRLTGNNEEEKLKFAKAWTKWEMATSKLLVDQENIKKGENDLFAIAFARIETHYFVHGAFFKSENHILDNCDKIQHIPTVIVQGRYDVVCPAKSAWELHKKLPNSQLNIIPDAGHSCSEKGIINALVEATDQFKNNKI